MPEQSGASSLTKTGVIALMWSGLLAGPLAWLLVLEINFALVPWACAFAVKWPLWLVTAGGLAVSAGGGALSWNAWRKAGREWPSEAGGAIPRSRFLAAGGVLISVFFFVALIAQGVTQAILGACQ